MGKGNRNRQQRKNTVTMIQDWRMASTELAVLRTDLRDKAHNGENIGVTLEDWWDKSFANSNTAMVNGFQLLRMALGSQIKDYLESIKDDFKPLDNVLYNEHYDTADDINLFHRFYGWFWEVYWMTLNGLLHDNPDAYTDDIEHDVMWDMILAPELGLGLYYKYFIEDECRPAA